MLTVEYDDVAMKAALRAYVARAMLSGRGGLSIAAGVLVVAALTMRIALRDWTFVTGVLVGLVAAILAMVVAVYFAHWRGMRTKLARMTRREATFRLADEDIAIEADSGSTRMPWATFKDVWRFVLMLAINQVVTLPLGGAPQGALDFISAKVVPSRR